MNLKRGRKLNLAQTKYGGGVTESEVLFQTRNKLQLKVQS